MYLKQAYFKQKLAASLILLLAGICLAHDNRPEPPPKHNGVVFTSGTFDVEAVLDKPKGRYELYFFDVAGLDVPANVLSGVGLSIRHAGGGPEKIPMRFDTAAKAWVGSGAASNARMISAMLSYQFDDFPIQTEIPFATSFHAELQTKPQVVKAGVPVQLSFTIQDFYGKNIEALEIVHTKPMHLMVVSSDLAEFSHIHPVQKGEVLSVSHVFPYGGHYRLYADFTPQSASNVIQPFDLNVQGPERAPIPLESGLKPVTLNGVRMTMTPDGPLRTGEDIGFSMSVADAATGKPIHDLQPYLGAWAHIAIISQDTQDFIHTHPLDDAAAPVVDGGPSPGTIRTTTGFRRPGLYKWWTQVQRDNKVITFPFVLRVEAGTKPVTRITQAPPPDATLVKVSSSGFEPALLYAVEGKPLKLAFVRLDAQNCAREVVFPDLGIRRALPPGETVVIEIAPQKTGTILFSCGMKMLRGQLLVQPPIGPGQ